MASVSTRGCGVGGGDVRRRCAGDSRVVEAGRVDPTVGVGRQHRKAIGHSHEQRQRQMQTRRAHHIHRCQLEQLKFLSASGEGVPKCTSAGGWCPSKLPERGAQGDRAIGVDVQRGVRGVTGGAAPLSDWHSQAPGVLLKGAAEAGEPGVDPEPGADGSGNPPGVEASEAGEIDAEGGGGWIRGCQRRHAACWNASSMRSH